MKNVRETFELREFTELYRSTNKIRLNRNVGKDMPAHSLSLFPHACTAC